MTPLILLRGLCLFEYFRSDGPYSSVSPHAVVTVSMSPRTQACLNVVDAMPNSFAAAASVQYLLAFFTSSYPALYDSKLDPVHTIAFGYRDAEGNAYGAHQMVQRFKKNRPGRSIHPFFRASADAASAG